MKYHPPRDGRGYQAPAWFRPIYRLYHWAWCQKCHGTHPLRSRFRERIRTNGDMQPIIGLVMVTMFLWLPALIWTSSRLIGWWGTIMVGYLTLLTVLGTHAYRRNPRWSHGYGRQAAHEDELVKEALGWAYSNSRSGSQERSH